MNAISNACNCLQKQSILELLGRGKQSSPKHSCSTSSHVSLYSQEARLILAGTLHDGGAIQDSLHSAVGYACGTVVHSKAVLNA